MLFRPAFLEAVAMQARYAFAARPGVRKKTTGEIFWSYFAYSAITNLVYNALGDMLRAGCESLPQRSFVEEDDLSFLVD